MRRPALAAAALLAFGTTGCDRIPFLGGGDSTETPAESTVVQQAAPTAAAPDSTPAPEQPRQPVTTPPTVRQAPAVSQAPTARPPQPAASDEPWTPTFTGIVDPGMTRDQVVGVWGPPVTERTQGDWTYLYYRNGCEVSCGTYDVVLLQGNQVVDAIVRGQGHTYSGVSSSPPGRTAMFTPPAGRPEGGGNTQ